MGDHDLSVLTLYNLWTSVYCDATPPADPVEVTDVFSIVLSCPLYYPCCGFFQNFGLETLDAVLVSLFDEILDLYLFLIRADGVRVVKFCWNMDYVNEIVAHGLYSHEDPEIFSDVARVGLSKLDDDFPCMQSVNRDILYL